MFRHESGPPTRATRRRTLVTSGCPGAGVRSIDSKALTPVVREEQAGGRRATTPTGALDPARTAALSARVIGAIGRSLAGIERVVRDAAPADRGSGGKP